LGFVGLERLKLKDLKIYLLAGSTQADKFGLSSNNRKQGFSKRHLIMRAAYRSSSIFYE
jgi:hypothetical protein